MEKFNGILSGIKRNVNKLKLDFEKFDNEKIVLGFKEKKYLILSVLIFIIILLAMSVRGIVVTKDELLKDLEVSIREGRVSKIYGNVLVFDEKVSKEELNPLLKYYSEENEKINKLLSELKSSGASGIFTVKSNRKAIWQNYYLEVNTIGIKVNCNFKDAKIFLDNKEIKTNDIKMGIIPGIYTIKAHLETNYGEIEKEVEVSLMENEEVFVKLDAVDLSITSNFNDANVLINDEDIDKKVSEFEGVSIIPTDKNIYIQLQREFPWGIIKSEKIKVSDTPSINLDINMVNEELITQIEVAVDKFYGSVFDALNKKDSSLIALTNEEVQKKIYDDINKKSLILDNNYEIRGLETKIENSEFKYENNVYEAQVVVKINYSIYKKLFALFQREEENMFLTNMELVGDKWFIKGIQKFNLE